MKFAYVNQIQNLQRQILAMLEKVAILNVNFFLPLNPHRNKNKKKVCN